ncbi:MAG: [protein-PII] uridylyltransferase [Myxococcota bacterium]
MPVSPNQPAIDLSRLSPVLPGVCSNYLHSYRHDLEKAVRGGASGVDVARRHACILDGLLGALYCAADAAARKGGSSPVGRVALVAVGGYGRGLVGLHSDVDVLFLCDDPADPHVGALAEGLLYPLWDLGLQIGHAARGIDETLRLAREDIRTATTLIDLRRIGGDDTIVADLDRGGRRQVFEPALDPFLDALTNDTRERHERFGGSLYLLEPEVKLGRGGLRDLDVAEWAARARWAARSTEDYIRTGALLAREVAELEEAREMLWRVRNLLHLRAGRQQDRLTFEDQEEIAVSLGFADGVTLAVEQFMQSYYRHARIVALTAERMLDRARPRRRRGRSPRQGLADGTMVFDDHITLQSIEAIREDPPVALRLYQQVARRNKPPYPFARDAIARIAVEPHWRERLRTSPEASELFLGLLTHVDDAPVRRGSILGELHEVGLMLAMIPEFEPVTGRVQHDVYHVYTVDVHSVRAVDRLRKLMQGGLAAELPLASRLAAEEPRRAPLFLGLLLHDAGKAHGKNHSEKGAEMAGPIAERLGLASGDVEHVVWLVREHLSLYHWATRRDTSDPDVIADLARRVGTPERLRDLYLLTIADLSTTNPGALTSWKARMLEDLYLAVAGAFEEGAPTSVEGRAVKAREEVRVGFVGDAGQEQLEAFLEEMPDRYLLANPVDVVRRHARVARDRGDALARVTLAPGPAEDLYEITVVTDDRPGLLADVAAVVAAGRMAIVGAQIYTRRRPDGRDEAFDVLHVRHQGRVRSGRIDASVVRKVERDLCALLRGEVTAADLMARVPKAPSWAVRHVPEVPTEVTVDNDVSASFTVVDVYTRDRVGVLHVIARTLHEQGLTIGLSKINTEGMRVADVFYVQESGGGKLADPGRLQALQNAVRMALERFDDSEARS